MEPKCGSGDPAATGTGASQVRSFKMSDLPGVEESYKKTGRIPNLKIKLEQTLLEINLPGTDPYRLILPDGRALRLEPGVNVIDPPAQLHPGDVARFKRIRQKHRVAPDAAPAVTIQSVDGKSAQSEADDYLDLDDSLIEAIPAAVEHHRFELAQPEPGTAPTCHNHPEPDATSPHLAAGNEATESASPTVEQISETAAPGGRASAADPSAPQFTFGQGLHRRGGFWTRFFAGIVTGGVS